MNFFNLDNVRYKLYKINSFKIFISSFLICALFYIVEGLFGIDRFYHPDSAYYLIQNRAINFIQLINNPKELLQSGYFIITHLLNYNYYLLIFLNFILYSLTNVLIYQKVFKKNFKSLSNLKLIFLFYLLFLDPYRLHLASHILKETIIIYIFITIIIFNLKIIKLLGILLLEMFRHNSWVYLLIFLTYSNIKKILKKKSIYKIIILLIIFLSFFALFIQTGQDLSQSIFNFVMNKMELEYNKTFPMRPYDQVNQFKDYGFPLGFILKSITWPSLLISGFFIFFISSVLFKILGIIIILNHILVYIITKKTFVSFGLLIILLMLSVYTGSYTSMFRYSYIAIYSSVIYFFLNFNIKRTNIS